MLELTEYMLINLIRLIILISTVDVRVFGDKKLSVRISFMIFAIELSDIGRKKKKRRSKSKRSSISFLTTLFKIQISKSIVTVRSFDVSSISRGPVGSLFTGILGATVIAYLKAKSLGFISEEREGSGNIDITFSFPLYTVIISLILASYYNLKKRFKRRSRNVRI